MQNVQPTETFVFTNNYTDTLKLPLSMIFTGNINTFQVDGSNCYTSDYNTILFRWTTNFSVNDGYPDPVNISELKKNSVKNFTLFPNPNNGKFILKCDIENGKMKIENILGETVFQSIIKHDNLTAIDISEKPTGIYFIEITSDKEKETLKMIKF
jgi:Secretion system C-terminal sorting domain